MFFSFSGQTHKWPLCAVQFCVVQEQCIDLLHFQHCDACGKNTSTENSLTEHKLICEFNIFQTLYDVRTYSETHGKTIIRLAEIGEEVH